MTDADCHLCPGICPHDCPYALPRRDVLDADPGAAHEPLQPEECEP
jgi:hypothetical protein